MVEDCNFINPEDLNSSAVIVDFIDTRKLNSSAWVPKDLKPEELNDGAVIVDFIPRENLII